MKHLAAYCLLVLAGKQNPSKPPHPFVFPFLKIPISCR